MGNVIGLYWDTGLKNVETIAYLGKRNTARHRIRIINKIRTTPVRHRARRRGIGEKEISDSE